MAHGQCGAPWCQAHGRVAEQCPSLRGSRPQLTHNFGKNPGETQWQHNDSLSSGNPPVYGNSPKPMEVHTHMWIPLGIPSIPSSTQVVLQRKPCVGLHVDHDGRVAAHIDDLAWAHDSEQLHVRCALYQSLSCGAAAHNVLNMPI